MAKHGYVIAKSQRSNTEFFTSYSSYNKPVWTPLEEATIYASAELAQTAASKLFKYGAYSATIVPLSELALEVDPRDDIELDSTENSGSEITLNLGSSDETDDLPPEDDMVADDQEDVCDICDHEPCTCPEDDIDGDGIEDVTDGGTPIETLAIDGQEVPLKTESAFDEKSPAYRRGVEHARTAKSPSSDDNPYDCETDVDEHHDWDRGYEAEAARRGYKKVGESVESLKIKDTATQDDANRDAGADVSGANDDKIKVPASVLTSLRSTFEKFNNCSDLKKTHNEERSSFCMTVAAATQTLIDDLSVGTVEGLKMAQVHLSSFMSPITNQFAPVVINFIQSGGVKTSLKALYDERWATARNQNGVL